jgi:hypothetical protein
MQRHHAVVFTAVLSIGHAQTVLNAQPPKRTLPRPKPATRAPAPATPVFERLTDLIGPPLALNIEQLPADYPGDPIEGVILSLNAGPKGEFETTTDYNARVASARPNRTFSFWLDRPIARRYDADSQTLKISIPTGCSYIGYTANCNAMSLGVKFVELNDGQFVGTNAFGASTVVKKVHRKTYAVFLKKYALSLDFELRMPPEQARLVKDGVDVLITVGPSSDTSKPVVVDGRSSSSATISSPLDSYEEYHYLAMPIIGVWLANRPSGHIFARFE